MQTLTLPHYFDNRVTGVVHLQGRTLTIRRPPTNMWEFGSDAADKKIGSSVGRARGAVAYGESARRAALLRGDHISAAYLQGFTWRAKAILYRLLSRAGGVSVNPPSVSETNTTRRCGARGRTARSRPVAKPAAKARDGDGDPAPARRPAAAQHAARWLRGAP
jgi:hypothetical protein